MPFLDNVRETTPLTAPSKSSIMHQSFNHYSRKSKHCFLKSSTNLLIAEPKTNSYLVNTNSTPLSDSLPRRVVVALTSTAFK